MSLLYKQKLKLIFGLKGKQANKNFSLMNDVVKERGHRCVGTGCLQEISVPFNFIVNLTIILLKNVKYTQKALSLFSTPGFHSFSRLRTAKLFLNYLKLSHHSWSCFFTSVFFHKLCKSQETKPTHTFVFFLAPSLENIICIQIKQKKSWKFGFFFLLFKSSILQFKVLFLQTKVHPNLIFKKNISGKIHRLD